MRAIKTSCVHVKNKCQRLSANADPITKLPDSRWERNGAGGGNEEGRIGESTPVDLSYITHRHIFWISGFKLCHTVHVVCPLVECLFIYTFVWYVQAWISVQGCLYACTHNLIYIYVIMFVCIYRYVNTWICISRSGRSRIPHPSPD